MFYQKRPHENSTPKGYVKSLTLHAYLTNKMSEIDSDIKELLKSGCEFNYSSPNKEFEQTYKMQFITISFQVENQRTPEFDYMSECENLTITQIIQKYAND